jgi:hypothetical protein
MNVQKTVLATLAGFVALFGLGFVIYVLLFPEIRFSMPTATGVLREYFPGIIAFEVLYGLLLTLICAWSGATSFNAGLRKGATVGIILGLCTGLWEYSTTTLFDANVIWWETLTFAVRFAVAGGLVGWVLGRK